MKQESHEALLPLPLPGQEVAVAGAVYASAAAERAMIRVEGA